MEIAQWTIAVLAVVSFLRALYTDIHGVKAHQPYGFRGVLVSIFLFIFSLFVYTMAGAFSTIWKF